MTSADPAEHIYLAAVGAIQPFSITDLVSSASTMPQGTMKALWYNAVSSLAPNDDLNANDDGNSRETLKSKKYRSPKSATTTFCSKVRVFLIVSGDVDDGLQ